MSGQIHPAEGKGYHFRRHSFSACVIGGDFQRLGGIILCQPVQALARAAKTTAGTNIFI
ncbi:hypothetical protein KCP75_11675 [Salmonella enterica subsp. enterica]|nr:hypothetical protein KCP75_11675 [Salmonella enterica subsp. enterica]